MKIHIISIFSESFNSFLNSSIIANAFKKWLFEIQFYKLNDFSDKKTARVDDKAYGMHGQVMSPEPLKRAIESIFSSSKKKLKIVYMSPSWDLLNQASVEKYFLEFMNSEFIIICGHYEWIDQRIIDLYVDYEISIWEYVLTSWELAAQVFIDSLVRHIPWVLGNKLSLEEDSFSLKFSRQKEYNVYTRPETFEWLKVPNVLLSWNHKAIEAWKISNLK